MKTAKVSLYLFFIIVILYSVLLIWIMVMGGAEVWGPSFNSYPIPCSSWKRKWGVENRLSECEGLQ